MHHEIMKVQNFLLDEIDVLSSTICTCSPQTMDPKRELQQEKNNLLSFPMSYVSNYTISVRVFVCLRASFSFFIFVLLSVVFKMVKKVIQASQIMFFIQIRVISYHLPCCQTLPH